MKPLLIKIDKLIGQIESGLLTRGEAFLQLRKLRNEIADNFEEGSDKFIQCISPLIDAHELAQSLGE